MGLRLNGGFKEDSSCKPMVIVGSSNSELHGERCCPHSLHRFRQLPGDKLRDVTR